MSEWKEYRLGEVCTELSDGLHKAPNFKKNGDYIFVNAKNIVNGFIIDNDPTKKSTHEEYLKYASPLNDTSILYSIDGTIGNIALYRGEKCILGKGACYMNPNPQILDRMFLYYELQSPRFKSYIYKMSTGSTIKHISLKTMRGYDFSFPSLERQRRIASILSSLDDKIAVNRRICENLEAQAQALFKNWFVDFAPFKDGKFVESELGMIPEGWRVGRLNEVMDILPGGTPKTSNPEYWENGTIPFFSPKDVKGVYCFDTESYITQVGLDNCSSKLYEKDTIFITCRGTVGKVVLAASPMAMNQSNYALRGKEGISQYYLYYVIVSLVSQLKKLANGSTFAAITTRDFSVKIATPPLNEIEKFHCICESLFEQIYTMGLENLRLAALRDTLLPKLMSGEMKV
ncbi:MAG: restriction endonuclease subunit S [Bacteroidaceae bacterium]|nr:restriction endonuclease subunit S [Bacteroidaceae bacterium]